MSDHEPTAGELAEAEALAQALEQGSALAVPPPAAAAGGSGAVSAPADVLEVAALLRYSRPSAELAPSRRDAILEQLLRDPAHPRLAESLVAEDSVAPLQGQADRVVAAPPVSVAPKRGVVRSLTWMGVTAAAAAALGLIVVRTFERGEHSPSSRTASDARTAPASAGPLEANPIAAADPIPAEVSEPNPAAAASEAVGPGSSSKAQVQPLANGKGLAAFPTPEPVAALNAKAEAEVLKPSPAPKSLPRALDSISTGQESSGAAPGSGRSVTLPDQPRPGVAVPAESTSIRDVARATGSAAAAPTPVSPVAPAHWPTPGPQLLAAQSRLAGDGPWAHAELDRALTEYRAGVLRAIAARESADKQREPARPARSP
jgi:hypothetical protein